MNNEEPPTVAMPQHEHENEHENEHEHKPWSVDEYLAFEGESEIRHEFIAGEIFAMAGASRNHVVLGNTISSDLLVQLGERPCEVFPNDMRVQSAMRNYFYPDIAVVCGEEQYTNETENTLLNPTLIVEVLSPSTEDKDRGVKFKHYRSIPSLQEYWLFAQDQMLAERYLRKDEHTWEITIISDPDAVLDMPSIGCTLTLRDVYRRVRFEDEEADE